MEKLYWIALNFLRFKGKKEKFSLLFRDVLEGKHIESNIEQKFVGFAKREIEKAHLLNIKIVTMEDSIYPENLRNIPDPPVVLYIRGDLQKRDNLSVSMVGSRKCTPYGRSVARKFSTAFAKSGITVVSGLALGIDSESHRGAIDANGRTIAVLGSGVDIIYPSSNRNLADKISSLFGAVVSEFPLGTKPQKFNFPFRNRVISGISVATVVVEATEKSGSLITARLASEQGRDVFAVPGNITSKMSKGTNALIKDGAIPITEPDDLFSYEKVFSSLFDDNKDSATKLTVKEQKIISTIENSSETPGNISIKTGIPMDEVLRVITYMEIRGLVKKIGGRYLKV